MMKNRSIFLSITVLLTALICMCGFSMTAYAMGGEETPPEETAESTEPETPPNPVSLTPDGNLTLVDDIQGEQAGDKQFITVVTKDGNYFYIVIDRAGDKENVYFLNMVDEADLLALIEGMNTVPQPVASEPQPEPDPEPKLGSEPEPEQPEKKNKTGSILLIVLILAAAGGAFYYFKILKPKQGAQSSGLTELDDLDFDDEDDYLDMSAEEPVNSGGENE